MGLKDYRKFKREQELKDSETISFLVNEISTLNNEIRMLKGEIELLKKQNQFVQAPVLDEKEKEKIKAMFDSKTKPEDFIKLFADDIEEFNPNA